MIESNLGKLCRLFQENDFLLYLEQRNKKQNKTKSPGIASVRVGNLSQEKGPQTHPWSQMVSAKEGAKGQLDQSKGLAWSMKELASDRIIEFGGHIIWSTETCEKNMDFPAQTKPQGNCSNLAIT